MKVQSDEGFQRNGNVKREMNTGTSREKDPEGENGCTKRGDLEG